MEVSVSQSDRHSDTFKTLNPSLHGHVGQKVSVQLTKRCHFTRTLQHWARLTSSRAWDDILVTFGESASACFIFQTASFGVFQPPYLWVRMLIGIRSACSPPHYFLSRDVVVCCFGSPCSERGRMCGLGSDKRVGFSRNVKGQIWSLWVWTLTVSW